jgi:hypothetical protein
MAPKKKSSTKHVIVTTERRGVFYGALKSYDEKARVAVLENAAMAIYWGTTNGLLQLAATGPTDKSKISARAPSLRLELCECVIDVALEAEAAWAKR